MSETNKTKPTPTEQRLADAVEAAELSEKEGAPSASEPTQASPEVQALQAELDQAHAKSEETWQLYLQARADVENIRRRSERELAKAHKFALEEFVKALLPVKDSLEMGLTASSQQADVAQLTAGVELTLKMLTSVLEKFGVQEVNPQGEKFNPDLHEAMAIQPNNDVPANTVLHVVQKGYLLNTRLVRPAMVMVAKGAENSPSES